MEREKMKMKTTKKRKLMIQRILEKKEKKIKSKISLAGNFQTTLIKNKRKRKKTRDLIVPCMCR